MLWVNAAETWVDLVPTASGNDDGKMVNFLSETGVIDLFIFGTTPRKVSKNLARITGYQVLPPFFATGYHYSKWDKETSANLIMSLNEKFEEANFPVDVFWLDIAHTKNSEYFAFDSKTFSQKSLRLLNDVIEYSQRRIVVITDPHIRQHTDYRVYKTGTELDTKVIQDGITTSIFVK